MLCSKSFLLTKIKYTSYWTKAAICWKCNWNSMCQIIISPALLHKKNNEFYAHICFLPLFLVLCSPFFCEAAGFILGQWWEERTLQQAVSIWSPSLSGIWCLHHWFLPPHFKGLHSYLQSLHTCKFCILAYLQVFVKYFYMLFWLAATPDYVWMYYINAVYISWIILCSGFVLDDSAWVGLVG